MEIKNHYSFKEIIEAQKESLEDKIKFSVGVLSFALNLGKHAKCIAFSGGKDSEVVADLIERFLPEQFQNVHCVFGNTGIEFPESLKFAREYGKKHFGERFHETKLSKLEEDELKYTFARQLVDELEKENALDEILKPDGKLKGQKALINAALKRGYKLTKNNCYFAGQSKTFAYCVEQYGAPLLGKSASKLDAHRINIECFLKYSQSETERDELKEYYSILRECKFSQHCCKLLKKDPSEKLQAELDTDVIIKGLMASESHTRMTSISTRGCIFESHRDHITDGPFYHVNPIAFWTDDDIWDYIHKYNLEYSPLYDITYIAEDGTEQHIKRNGCIMCGTDIAYKDNHLAILRQTHPKAWQTCMKTFGYEQELYKLFKLKKNKNILTAMTSNGTKARLIETFGDIDTLMQARPCVYDEFGELVDISGTGLENEYDAEVTINNETGQLKFVFA